jgi:hypothetical protein
LWNRRRAQPSKPAFPGRRRRGPVSFDAETLDHFIDIERPGLARPGQARPGQANGDDGGTIEKPMYSRGLMRTDPATDVPRNEDTVASCTGPLFKTCN